MTDRKKLAFLATGVIAIYSLFYFQRDIGQFLQNPFANLNWGNGQTRITNTLERTNLKVVEEENATINLVEVASPAVVSVVRNDVYFDYRRGPIEREDSIGTGFIIDGREGYILTNKHVVDAEGATFSILTNDERSFDVTQVSLDPINDFAILQVDLEGSELPQLELGDSDKIRVGQTVIAIGNALGEFGNSVTKGIVSGLGRGIIAQGGVFGPAEYIDDVIQTDAALNPGNSGGPLLNLEGQVIGINVAISQGAENVGFSIPINTLKPAVDTFKQNGRIIRPFLGIEYRQITRDIAQERNIPVGAFVQRVVPNSPADDGGIRVGDIILSINGVRLDDENNSLARVVARQTIDQNIPIVVDRDGREVNLRVALADADD